MSAFVVSKTHIDALLTAGLRLCSPTSGPLRWFDSDDIPDNAYQEGEVWGPGSIAWWAGHHVTWVSHVRNPEHLSAQLQR
jgi:hypothetical protein